MNSSNSIYDQVIWFTGLSGSGKTTIALELKKRFDSLGITSIILDGDNLRNGLKTLEELPKLQSFYLIMAFWL